jgi:hypothetical protein
MLPSIILYHIYIFPYVTIITLCIRVKHLKFANYVTKCNCVKYVYFPYLTFIITLYIRVKSFKTMLPSVILYNM